MHYMLKVYNKEAKEERTVTIINWNGWDLEEIPNIDNSLSFMKQVWNVENKITGTNKHVTHTTVIHGVSGTRRTSAYCIINILCRQLTSRGSCAIVTTAVLIRKYRYNVLKYKVLFATVLIAVLNYAADIKLIKRNELNLGEAIKIITNAMTSKEKDKFEIKNLKLADFNVYYEYIHSGGNFNIEGDKIVSLLNVQVELNVPDINLVRFDPREGKWIFLIDIPNVAYYTAVTTFENTITCAGGWNANALCQTYDTRIGKWDQIACLAAPISGGKSIENQNSIIVAGGYNNDSTDVIQAYNKRKNVWDILDIKLPISNYCSSRIVL
uniref:Tyrosine-protein phosphatase domain-containing protein n=1 Tax=Rhabditophanes sp. KR3021 TaxID=114890 RepID=A0AC35TKT1_9BILA